MMTEPKPPVKIYLIYAQKDEALKQEFEDYLITLQQTQLIAEWVERRVQQGTDWSHIVDPSLVDADLILVLVSPGLLASGYCSGAEFRMAFEKTKAPKKAALVPIILHPVNVTGNPLETIQCTPMNHQPVSSWPTRYEAWRRVDQDIREVIQSTLRPAW